MFELGNIFENFDQKIKKHDILPKNHSFGIFWHFLVKIFKKYCQIQKFEEKKNCS